ncbi:hypothetical protein HZB93_03490 [Candidatus Falkowbacteria bacterium]|nr:hypothetical protein [Candidatus Falkowbacteria bacterium]
MPEISLKKWKLIGLVSLLLIVITSLPILFGFLSTPQNNVFLGLQFIDHADTPVYYSWIEQAKDGHLLFKNLFTSENEGRFIFDPFWLGVGLSAKTFSLSSFAAYQLARIFLIPIFLAVAYIFISHFFTEEKKRKLGFLFLIFASGLGWMVWLISKIFSVTPSSLPMDLWVPEAFTFSTLYNSPHFIASLTLFITVLLLTLFAIERGKKIYSLGAGFAALFLFQFHPYNAPTLAGILGLHFLFLCIENKKIRWDILKHYFILLSISLPAIIYHAWTLKNFWTRQQFALQNICLTPGPGAAFLSYGLLLILACFGVFVLLKKEKTEKSLFLLAWFFAQIILIYAPFNFQRRMTAGLQIVMSVLAVISLFYLYDTNSIFKKFAKKKILMWFIFIVFLGLSNYFLITDDLIYYSNPPQIYSSYLSLDKKEAMVWLKNNTAEENIILATPVNGNLLPALSLRPVYVGQWSLTAAQTIKTERLQYFFGTPDSQSQTRAVFLKINNINYLFFGPEEKAVANFNPETDKNLDKVYQNGEVTIYKVKNQ